MSLPTKTTAQRKADGSYHSARHDGIDRMVGVGKPKMPKGLDPDQRKLWRSVVAQMGNAIGEIDTEPLTELVEAWKALRDIRKEFYAAPYDKDLRLAFQAIEKTYNRLADQFGMSPKARQSLIQVKSVEQIKNDDLFGEIVGRIGSNFN